jgi:PleD family two-component response regulator
MKPRAAQRSAPIRVVVIDDDDFEREFLVDLLRTAGFDVSSLSSVFGVTNHLVNENVEVVVLDVMMPSIRGDKLAALFRKNPALPNLRVVLVSSLPEAEVAPLMMQVQVDAFVAKANVRSELPGVIASVVAG